jgi:hypothetical protein
MRLGGHDGILRFGDSQERAPGYVGRHIREESAVKRIRTEPIEPTLGPMPVFAVPAETMEITASPEETKRAKKVKQGTTRASEPQQIGTAYALSDGSIGVQLTSIPLDGKLIVRMPRARRGPDAHR